MICRITPLLLVLATGLHVHMHGAGPVNLDGLVSNSPFSGPAAAPVVVGNTDSALELRGVLVDRGETFFSLYDSSSRSSRWVGLNEPGNPFVVQQYDSTSAQAVVQYQGRNLILSLKQAKVVAIAAAPTSAATNRPPPANPPASAAPGATADEARRLAAVADEIRPRRTLRQRAIQPDALATRGRN